MPVEVHPAVRLMRSGLTCAQAAEKLGISTWAARKAYQNHRILTGEDVSFDRTKFRRVELTDVEREAARLVGTGMSRAQAGRVCSISAETVRNALLRHQTASGLPVVQIKTSESKNEVVSLLQSGMSVSEIAKKLNCSKGRVQNVERQFRAAAAVERRP